MHTYLLGRKRTRARAQTLVPILHMTLPDGAECKRGLEIGCGDRPLAPELASDAHFSAIEVTAVDFSPAVIRAERQRQRQHQLEHQHQHQRPRRGSGVVYETMDARAMDKFKAGTFEVARA